MFRAFFWAVVAWILHCSVGAAQAQDQAPQRFLQRVDPADAQAEIKDLQRQVAELEAAIAKKKAELAERHRRNAELTRDVKAAHDRLAKYRGEKTGLQPPLMFPVEVERAMLSEGARIPLQQLTPLRR